MKKVLFIDRDGTLVVEPKEDQQLDSLEKLEFFPTVFQGLSKIAQQLDYVLVMVTNQDGLGTNTFPEESFWPAHGKIIQALANEEIKFTDVLIDKSLPKDSAPTRKPETGMLQKYMHGPYDLANSFVIGDRQSDMQLAANLGCKGIFIGEGNEQAVINTTNWNEVYEFLSTNPRTATVERRTSETNIAVQLNLDGNGKCNVQTGIGFFDHMLEQVCRHGGLNLSVLAKGDLQVDEHHTIEDTALALGEAFRQSLGSTKGIERYGFLLPMDDCLAQVALDFGGRPSFVWEAAFKREKIGDMPTEMFSHFFKSFSDTAKCNLNIQAWGGNEHHKIEAIFKAFAKSIKMAVRKTEQATIPSTKGVVW